jgi:phenylacetate-CoA ligase
MSLHAWLLRPSSKDVFIALRKTQYASADQLKEFRTRQLIRIVWHAYVNVPYYRNAMNRAGVMPEEIKTLDDIRKLPLLSKDDLAQNVHYAMFSRDSNWKTTQKIVTSGSTGRPSISYGEQSQLEIRAGSTLRAAEWTGWRIGDRQMRLWHQTLGMSWTQSIREKIDALLLRRRFIPAFEMTEDSLNEFIRSIESFKPVLIDGYAESLNLIASFLRAGKSIRHQPKGVISSAQMLTSQTRHEIETALATTVFDKYGAREFSGIAYECEEGSKHVMDDSYILELLKAGVPASVGDTGEVVITDLNNFAVPMIRYRIGDLAVQPKRANCPCGRSMSLIGKIEGRTQALVHCANGRWMGGAFFLHFFKDYESQISYFQVVQKVRGAFDLLVVKNNNWNPIAWQRVIEELKGYVGGTDIKVRFVREIPMLKTGKRTPVTSKVPFDFQNQ